MADALHAHEAYKRLLAAEVGQLPPDLRVPWELESKRVIVTLKEARETKDKKYLKKPKAPGNWAPASSLITVYHVNRLLIGGSRLTTPTQDLREILKRERVIELLHGPLAYLGGPAKILHLRAGKTFMERILKLPTCDLDVIMLRIRANELARDYSDALMDYSHYREAALALEPNMLPGEPHDVTSAIMAREKAIACIAVSIDPRLGEFGGLSSEDILIDGRDATCILPAEFSKEREVQKRALDWECAQPVIEYKQRARPFLSGLRRPGTPESDALWLTRTGTPLVQNGVEQALSITLSHAMGVPVGAKILRKVMASREDIAEHEIGAALGHALRSLLGIDLYSVRDERRARRHIVSLWEMIDRKIWT